MNNFEALYKKAFEISPTRKLSEYASCGGVGAALLATNGTIYTGVCIDAQCSLGFCAEHSAAAEMLKHGESRVVEIVAVLWDGKVLPPCGRCRELLSQINPENKKTIIHFAKDRSKTLAELLPESYS